MVGDPNAGEEPGELHDLARELPDGARIAIVTAKDEEQALALIRHDAAHVLAAAVMELWPGVKISIGPAIENGFYYDFEFPEGTTISEADFPSDRRAHARARERGGGVRARRRHAGRRRASASTRRTRITRSS